MLRNILAASVLLCASAAFAAIDVNKASEADLDGIRGLGPATTRLILEERAKGEFKNWPDLIARVKGLHTKKAAHLSASGLRVGETPFADAK